jgi:hypothetical protein
MTAFARRRTWCQSFIVRRRYWVSIAGQGIRRPNGHLQERNGFVSAAQLIPRGRISARSGQPVTVINIDDDSPLGSLGEIRAWLARCRR